MRFIPLKSDRRRKTNIPNEELRRLYLEEKLTFNQLGEHFKCSRNTIAYWLRGYKIKLRTPSESMKLFVNRPEKISEKELYELFSVQGVKLQDIAKDYNCKLETIVRKIRRYNLANKFSNGKRVVIGKGELKELYWNKKLTTYDIAERFGCCQATIWKRLKSYNIKRRDAHSPDYFNIPSYSLLKKLYVKERLSSWKIERKYGFSRSTIHRHLRKCNLIRSRAEAHRRYTRRNFDGDSIDKAYLIGFRIGDLRVRKVWENGETISVDCGTTKTEQISLIKSLFNGYGRIWIKRIKSRTDDCYQIEVLLNESFSFLLDKSIPLWIFENKLYFFSFLAGFTDAEGTIGVSCNHAYYSLVNQDKDLLDRIRKRLINLGMAVPRLILGSKKGSPTRFGKIIYYSNKDCWVLKIQRKESLYRLLNSLQPYLRYPRKAKNLKLAKTNILARNGGLRFNEKNLHNNTCLLP